MGANIRVLVWNEFRHEQTNEKVKTVNPVGIDRAIGEGLSAARLDDTDVIYRIVLAGCGSMARQWVEYALARPDAQIVALVDVHLPAAASLARRYGLTCPHFADLAQAIRATDANLVFDVTVPEAHKQVVLTATSLGCDVFGEKPMATSMADAIEVARAVRESGRTYAVMQNRRFSGSIRQARAMIDQNVIGTPAHATADFFLAPHFGGFRESMDHPLLLDMAIHTFDQARYLLQADPVAVYCRSFNPGHSWYRGDAAAVCIFDMSDGSVFVFNGSWCAEGEPTSWNARWRIAGSQGTLLWDGDNAPYCSVVAGGQEEGALLRRTERVHPTLPWTGNEGHAGCLDEMFDALQHGRKAETDSSDNLLSMAMVFAAIESAARGEKVRIGPLLGRE